MKAIVKSELEHNSGGNARTDFLQPGQYLNKSDQLISPNGLFRLLFDTDGELKLYDWNNTRYWKNDKTCTPGKATFRTDGIFEVKDKNGDSKWKSNGAKFGTGESGFITLQNNGNLVIYDDQQNRMLWQTNTIRSTSTLTRNVLYSGDVLTPGDMLVSSTKFFRLTYEVFAEKGGGSMTIRDWNDAVIWTTNTDGEGLGRVIMQPDGNFCLYNSDKQFCWGWTSDYHVITTGSFVKLEDNGNLVVYRSDKRTIAWQSNTGRTVPSSAHPTTVQTTPTCGVVAMANGGVAATSICGGVLTGTSGCGAVMSGIGMCGAVYSGASFCGAVANTVGLCAADVATFGVCGVVAAASGASVVSVTAVGACGAVATIAGVCGAVVAAAGASAIGATGVSACGAVTCGAAACGADASGAGACIEAQGAGACGANATGAQGTGVCGAQVGFCGAVLCVAIPLGGNW